MSDSTHREHEEHPDEQRPVGSLDPAPVTPVEERTDPEAGTGSADKRSPESLAEQDGPPEGDEADGTTGGNSSR